MTANALMSGKGRAALSKVLSRGVGLFGRGLAVLGFVMGAQVAHAAPDKAICAVEQAIACPPYQRCSRSLPGAVNLPSLMKIDRTAGVVMTRAEGGEERKSEIVGEIGDDSTLMIQGFDGAHAWNMRLDLTSGHFVLTSAADDAGYVAFGLCSTNILD